MLASVRKELLLVATLDSSEWIKTSDTSDTDRMSVIMALSITQSLHHERPASATYSGHH